MNAAALTLDAATGAPSGDLQGTLFDLSEIQGFGDLSRREREFAEGIFAGLSQRQAAKAAGVQGDDASLDVTGSRLMRKPAVQRFLSQAWSRSGANIHETLRQAVRMQARAMSDWENSSNKEARAAAAKEWREASALIASIHGRLSINVNGQINHAHAHIHGHAGEVNVIPPEALPVFAAIRRGVIQERADAEAKNTATAA